MDNAKDRLNALRSKSGANEKSSLQKFAEWARSNREEEESDESAFERFLDSFIGSPIERGERKKKLGHYNEGGMASDMDAVFSTSRTEVDPVSGNEVPPGAVAEEVRDDVPAMLSEGEYVVPADVLRYYGVRFFEKLREEAKEDLTEMEDGGRIGGEPIEAEEDGLPFDPAELAIVDDGEVEGYAEGGVVSSMQTPDFLSGLPVATGTPTGGTEYRTYKNAAGLTMSVPFFNGKPTIFIPAGYTEVASVEEKVAEQVAETSSKPAYVDTVNEGGYEGRGMDGPSSTTGRSAADGTADVSTGRFSGQTAEELSDALSNTQRAGKVTGAIGKIAPIVGLAGAAYGRGTTSSIARAAQEAYNAATTPQEKAEYAKVFNDATTRGKEPGKGIFGGGGLMGGGGTLNDTDNTPGVSFGDTALGDALGFDGKFGLNGPGFLDSFKGARRTGGTGTKSQSLEAAAAAQSKQNETLSALAPTTSARPQARPSDLGTASSTSSRSGYSNTNPNTGQVSTDPNAAFNETGQVAGTGWSGITAETSTTEADGDGPGGDKVICTAYNKLGMLSDELYSLDVAYGASLARTNPEIIVGYHRLATGVAKYIQKDTLPAKLVRYTMFPLAHAWAKQMAHDMEPTKYKRNYVGKAIMAVSYPVCAMLGRNKKVETHGTV